MRIYDLNTGRREDYYPWREDMIEDRRGRSRRSDGTYMRHEGYGPIDHYGHHDKERELEERERELERRERRIEDMRRYHEDDGMSRPRIGYWRGPQDGFDEVDDDRYYGDGPMMRRGRGGRYY